MYSTLHEYSNIIIRLQKIRPLTELSGTPRCNCSRRSQYFRRSLLPASYFFTDKIVKILAEWFWYNFTLEITGVKWRLLHEVSHAMHRQLLHIRDRARQLLRFRVRWNKICSYNLLHLILHCLILMQCGAEHRVGAQIVLSRLYSGRRY